MSKNLSDASSARKILESYKLKNGRFWKLRQQKKSLKLFHEMSRGVVGYKKFLKLNKIIPSKILGPNDLDLVPIVNKKNYFHKYPLKDLVRKDLLSKEGQVLTSTSGSTGTPTYFPRTEAVDWNYSVIAEFFLKNGPKGSTLLVDCFGMGVWIGGLITYQAFRITALRGQPVSIITPGINKKEIFHALQDLAPSFDNVILAGYPPFIKDILDESKREGVEFKKFNLRLLFAAESFTENFRDYVVSLGKIKDLYHDTLNLYGSAELGAMAFETPGAIFIRRLALANGDVYSELFQNGKIPTLAQYDPNFISFDERDGEILISADSATPFFHYQIGDHGGVYTFEQITKVFERKGIDLVAEARKAKVSIMELPFVYIYERSDFSTTLYGLQVYPQMIKVALETKELNPYLTGKFNMKTIYDKKSNQFLEVNIEMKPGVVVKQKLKLMTERSVINSLLQYNSEFKELTQMLGVKRTAPKIVFWPYNHEGHFRSGIKQQWLKK